jgi:DNA-binding XRE family transcriptional regulator
MSTKKIKFLDNSMKVDIGRRFRAFRIENKLSQKDLADELGLQQSTIASIETAVTFPSLPITFYIVKKFGLSLNWLLTGEGVMFPRAQQTSDFCNFQLINVVGIASCGSSGCVLDENIEGVKAFENSFINKFKKPILTRANGDSMLPVIHDGDLLLCDKDPYKIEHPDTKHLYLVNNPDTTEEVAITVKKLRLDGRLLTLIPLNPAYPPTVIDVDGKKIHNVVLGQVVWIGRELV